MTYSHDVCDPYLCECEYYLLLTLGKKLHSSVKNLQSNLYQLKIIIIIKWINKNNK